MEKTFYLALGADVVAVRVHPSIKTVGRAKQVLFNHGLNTKSKVLRIIQETLVKLTQIQIVSGFTKKKY